MKYWLYYFIRYTAELPFRVFFRSIIIEGLDKVPKDKPVLLAASHAGSFLDGVVIEYLSPYKVFTLVRGDAFNKGIFNKILRSMLLLPIFRARDAHAEKARKGNSDTYDECYELFNNNAKILIFSEGIAFPEKTTRKLKKGTAAMAADMIKRSNGEMDFYIIPVGINYSHFFKLRCGLQVVYGDPIRMLDYFDEMKSDDRAFAVRFTEQLQVKLDKLVVKTKGEFEDAKEIAHELLLNHFDRRSFFRQYNIGSELIVSGVDKVNSSNELLIKNYASKLKEHKIKDRNLSQNSTNFIAILTAIATAALSVPAAMIYALMWFGAKKFTKRKIKNEVLLDSVYFGLGEVATILWYGIVFTTVFVFLPADWTLLWKVIALISAIIGTASWFVTIDEVKHLWLDLKYLSLKKSDRLELQTTREEILKTLI